MSDYIKREDAVRRIAVLMAAEAESDGSEDQPMDTYIEYASEDLADIPPADVAPVVRCKDCRWRDAEEKHHCIDINRVFDQMDFCSFGERKRR